MTIDDADCLSFGREVIHREIEGLSALAENLDGEFAAACRLMLGCSGRIIVSGVGKSGHIGRKIAATMASTGTHAFFVHPTEASHGDLGMLRSDDLLLAISRSGESRELSDILLFSREQRLPVLAITKDADSTLGRLADVVLALPSSPEACPLERAPTTSTTMTLALGDALAMCLMKARGFSEKDFAVFHPGGKLGATMLTVADLLERQGGRPLPLVRETAPMKEVVLTMTEGMLGHAGVIGKDGRLVGVISDGDLRRAYGSGVASPAARDIMSREPKTVDLSMRAYEVRDLMKTHRISAVFIVDEEGRPTGLLHLQELLRL